MSWSAPDEWSRWDPDRLLRCPYDESHMIRAKRYPHHLLKCRKNHPDRDFVNCPFNAKHVMLRSEVRYHVSRCPDRTVVEQYSYQGSEKDEAGFYFKGDTSVPSYHKTDNIQWGSENWDDADEEQSIPQSRGMDFIGSFQQAQTEVRDTSSLSPEDQRQFKRSLKRDAVLKGSNSVGGIAAPWKKSTPMTINSHRQDYISNSCHNPIFDHCMEQMLVQSKSSVRSQQNLNSGSGRKASPRTYGSPTASTTISEKVSTPLAGVGRARLNAEARKNNFGGVCYSPPKPLDTERRNTSAVGRGRGVLNFMLTSQT